MSYVWRKWSIIQQCISNMSLHLHSTLVKDGHIYEVCVGVGVGVGVCGCGCVWVWEGVCVSVDVGVCGCVTAVGASYTSYSVSSQVWWHIYAVCMNTAVMMPKTHVFSH